MKCYLVALSFLSIQAQACFMPQPDQVTPWQELVTRSKTILLVENIGSTPQSGDETNVQARRRFQFKTIETLKGSAPLQLEVNGMSEFSDSDNDFSGHKDKQFWTQPNAGRVQTQPDCSLLPQFDTGKKYLLFVDKPYHYKSFELIQSLNDSWYKKVKTSVKASLKKSVKK